MPCTRVVFGARAKLGSGFHFISGPPSTIPFVERHGLSASFPPSPVFVAECVLYTRGWTVSGARKGLARVDIQLEILSSTVLILFSLVFSSLRVLSFLLSLCYVSLDRLDRRAPRLENPKRKCFRFVREAGIILSPRLLACFYSAKLLSALLQIVSHEDSFSFLAGGFCFTWLYRVNICGPLMLALGVLR